VTDLDVEVTMNMGGRILLFFCCILGRKINKYAVYCNQCSGKEITSMHQKGTERVN